MFGHPIILLGTLWLGLASTLLWLFVAAYGLSFSGLYPLWFSRQRLPARVESSQQVTLMTGEVARRTCALFRYRDATWRAAAYGETTLAPGQETTVVMPVSTPSHAWIEGLRKYPLSLSSLLRIAVLVVAPGLCLLGLGLLMGRRQRTLLREGVEIEGKRVRHLGLPRPLSDHYLDRFEFVDPGGVTRRIWSLGGDGPPEANLLVTPSRWRGALVVTHLLPSGQTPSGIRIVSAWIVLLLTLAQLAVLILFLLT